MNTRNTSISLAVCAAFAAMPSAMASQAVSAPISLLTMAQSGTATANAGTITGRVVEDARGAALPGAVIRVLDTGRETRTDREGRFSLPLLPPGTYRVEIDYLGYDTQVVEAAVSAAAGSFVEVRLRPAGAAQLDNIVVFGFRDQQSRELNQQRAADNIINVVSADTIGRFPDVNVAEALARVPGVAIERDQGEGRYVSVRGTPVDFNAVAVDGIPLPAPDAGTRAVDLDTIPTDIVASLEITKALTPNMDADSIGGHINIVTQSALDADRPILRGSAGYGRNQLGRGNNQRYAVTVGNQFGEGRVGALLTGSYFETNRETDNFEKDFATIGGQIFPTEIAFKDYELTRKRYAVNGRLDFAPGERTRINTSALYSRFIDDEFRHQTFLDFGGFAPGSTPTGGTLTDVELTKELRARRVENTITGLVLGGEHEFDRLTVDFRAATMRGKQEYPRRSYFAYTLGFEPDFTYDFSDPDNPRLTPDGGQLNQLVFDPADFDFSLYQVRARESSDRDVTLETNFSMPLVFANIAGDLRFGAKFRGKRKENDEDRTETTTNVAGLAYADAIRGDVSDNFGILLGNRFRKDLFSVYGPTYEADPSFQSIPRRRFTADFRADQDIYAAYVMSALERGDSRVVFGARVEQTRIDSSAFRFDRQTNLAVPTADSSRYTNFFPSLHYRREFGGDLIFRAAYTTALNRPELEDVVPSAQERNRGPGRREITRGNPDLDPTYAHNFDIMLEYYLRPLGVVSVGVFYKRLSDVIFDVVGNRLFEGEIWTVTEPENGDRGRVYGVELNWQQVFAFLPEPLSGLGVFVNYTYADSKADLPRGFGDIRLPGQSDHSFNGGVFYETGRFNARLAYNRRSEFVDSVSLSGREFDVYWDSRAQLDFTTSFQVSRSLQLYGEAANLTDSKQNRYRGDSSRVYEREGFGRVFQAGVRMNFE